MTLGGLARGLARRTRLTTVIVRWWCASHCSVAKNGEWSSCWLAINITTDLGWQEELAMGFVMWNLVKFAVFGPHCISTKLHELDSGNGCNFVCIWCMNLISCWGNWWNWYFCVSRRVWELASLLWKLVQFLMYELYLMVKLFSLY